MMKMRAGRDGEASYRICARALACWGSKLARGVSLIPSERPTSLRKWMLKMQFLEWNDESKTKARGQKADTAKQKKRGGKKEKETRAPNEKSALKITLIKEAPERGMHDEFQN
ncbi:hypothetical protein SERLA73DRAFT_134546 [Serpula lacrymans var. lacrymans S7.3]|uniref:Uncharacterized protein n=2 Tax=Serpula lacrymans var. lacrymans TaxID=341189 RepID=F8PS56_SERL3|nr:hypothetical protein SERLA73DRAFT_134546 [Serpula lacrymans var. lacrymans S7.3]